MLGRVGRVSEAYDFVERFGENGNYLKVWGSLLGSCRTHGEFRLAKVVASKLVEMGLMYEKGIVKETGCNWIDNDGCSDYFMSRHENYAHDDDMKKQW
ncbi:hypothetical protein Hanom_Chr02g00097611 [Helianthus anomalus]